MWIIDEVHPTKVPDFKPSVPKRDSLDDFVQSQVEQYFFLGTSPKAGETWHILHTGATHCATVKIVEITKHTVLFTRGPYNTDERLPLSGLKFVERVSNK